MSQLEPPTAPVATPEVSKKKPFYKRKWFIVLAVLMLIGAFASNSESSKTKTERKAVTTTEANTPAAPNETVSESNARKKAESYLSLMAFSRSGLITQLEYEGFSNQDATYGADAVNANWNEQAAKKAASYLETMAFSRSGLMTQLLYEGFTEAQASYGVATTGL
jgi:hypothetical protein